MGDWNLLVWVVLNSDESMINELNEPLSKLCAIICKGCWERLLSTDKYVFSLDHNGNRFKKKNDIPF